MRDDFLKTTKEVLAKRVGYICSNPNCRMHTVGPNSEADKATSIGVAAHITAASEGGPRYNPSLSIEERTSVENGIWLCQSCSRLIDRDPQKYTAQKLNEWKKETETLASQKLNKQLSKKAPYVENSDIEKIKPNGYYKKNFKGQKIRYYLDGDLLHIEHEPEEGIVAYYVVDKNGNVIDTEFPFPLEEYELDIDQDLILNSSKRELKNGLTKEVLKMKWGKAAVIIRNQNQDLVHFNVKNGATVNHSKKKIWIKSPDFN